MPRNLLLLVLCAAFSGTSLLAGDVELGSLFQMDNVRAMAVLINAGLSTTFRLVPPHGQFSAAHGQVDMQWPPSGSKVAPGSAVTLYVTNRGTGNTAVPSPFEGIALRYALHDTRIRSGQRVTGSGAGSQTSSTDFFGFHLKGVISGCKARTLVLVRLTGQTLQGSSEVTRATIGADGSFDVAGTVQGPLESRFLDEAGNLVFYERTDR